MALGAARIGSLLAWGTHREWGSRGPTTRGTLTKTALVGVGDRDPEAGC